MNLKEWNKLSFDEQEKLFNELKENHYKRGGRKNEDKKQGKQSKTI